ncbi:hypothetical protein NW768_007663 [Fusarium equiseti]|uniref:NAD(P)-binding domain-containing protein n=1 Tax=Fusarium equiseti TaxID=61235 RepID=A0ABQ8R8R9_FUSEQ|nr:hypothetical protein NW768_007663 [Fusarium equiseti]
MPPVIVFGASGYVGAPYTRALKQAPPDWQINAYVRSTEPTLKTTLKVDRIMTGDFTDFEKIRAVSAEHDIAVNAGNSFTSEPVAAIIAGQQSRPTKGKVIHISGAGNFIDFGTSGNFNPGSKVWNDANEDDIRANHKDMFNGQSDTLVLQAGGVDSWIVCLSVVYGGATAEVKTMGVGYRLFTGYVKTLGYVPCTHVLDLIDFLIMISDVAAQGPAEGTQYSRYYMIETSRVAWKDLATQLAKAMHARGILPSAEPKNVPFEEAGEGEAKHLIAANMLIQGDRAAAMGYKARYPSILEQIHEDLREIPI